MTEQTLNNEKINLFKEMLNLEIRHVDVSLPDYRRGEAS